MPSHIRAIAIHAAFLLFTVSGQARAQTSSDNCSIDAVQMAIKTMVVSEFQQKTNFGTVFDLGKSNFQIINARQISAASNKIICEGRFITSFFVKTGLVPESKTMTALSSLARYELTSPGHSTDVRVGALHQVGSDVLVCYHDSTCGPIAKAAPYVSN